MSKAGMKQAPKINLNKCPERQKTTVRIRNKHGRFESHTPLVNQAHILSKEKVQRSIPTSSAPISPLLAGAFRDKEKKTAGPAAAADFFFLPDLRRAELDQLVTDMIQHFPGGTDLTPEHLKAVEGYFNYSDPGRRLDGFRFKLYRDFWLCNAAWTAFWRTGRYSGSGPRSLTGLPPSPP
jgi:hypothetical protein